MCPSRWLHADQRRAGGERRRLRGGHPDQERADQTRADGHGDAVDVAEPDAGLLERLRQQRVERLHVRAGGDLGHDAAEPLVQVLLAGDQVRAHVEAVLDAPRRRSRRTRSRCRG